MLGASATVPWLSGPPATTLPARLAHNSRLSMIQAFWRCRPTTLTQELPFMGMHSVSKAFNMLFYS